MKKLRIARSAATALAVASVGLASLVTTPAAVNLADCPAGLVLGQRRGKTASRPACRRIPRMDALPATARISTARSASIRTWLTTRS